MKRTTTTIAAVCAAALLIPVVGASAKPDGSKRVAIQQCKQERKADKGAFRATYGPRAAMRNCIRTNDSAFSEAAETCREERSADPEGFRETYGTNEPNEKGQGRKRNAFGKCVSTKVKEGNTEEEPEA